MDYEYFFSSLLVLYRLPLQMKEIGSDDQIRLLSCSAEFDPENPEHLLEIKVAHEIIGELYTFQCAIWRLIPEAEQNVLLAALTRFCPQPRLQELLTKPYEQRPKRLKESSAFELHVSWVLSMCGFSVVVLGEYERLLAEQTTVERASVDILAAGPNRRSLLVAACTIGTPREEDFVNVVHACEILHREVFQQTSVAVFPIIFTGAVGIPSYREIGGWVVPIVDTDRMNIVVELLQLRTERLFLDFVGNPQLCELRSPKQELI